MDISVIVPCYNAERYLSVCLESLRAQKEPQIEIILIDDGSSDTTGAMLDAYAVDDPRARVIHTPNGGVSAARNRGIDMARGRYIAFVDADDALEENSLSALHQAAVRSGAEIISANHTIFDVEKNARIPVETEPVVQQPMEIVKEIIHMHRIYNNIWNKLYDRSLFEGVRLDERVRIGEDVLLNMRLYLRARRVHHLSQRTYVYRVHSLSAMAGVRGHAKAHQPMLLGMNEILKEQGIKELYFADYLQSCIWMDEKEKGIRACMRTFNDEIRPLAVEGVDERRISRKDERLWRMVQSGSFPAFYLLMRARERVTGKRWGIRR